MNLDPFYRFLSRFSFNHSKSRLSYVPDSEPGVLAADGPVTFEKATTEESPRAYTPEQPRRENGKSDSGTTGVIPEDMVIDGSVTAASNLIVSGVINGNVSCTRNVEIRGRIKGDVQARNVRMLSSEVTGDIHAEEGVLLNGGVVNGSLHVQTAEINGTVNGSLSVSGVLGIRGGAVIKGDITAAVASMEQNAVVDGKMTIGGRRPDGVSPAAE